MGLGGKVNHAVQIFFREKMFKKGRIPYVPVDKAISFQLVRRKVIKIGRITGIG